MSNEQYLVTARKYRPQKFSDLVSQRHVTETLKNAVKQDRLAQAYLFSGPRGVGKTTVARILAQAINCTADPADREDAEPCGKCDSCLSFLQGRSLSIIEIDAASNNSVDDIRALREKVRIPPQGARKKVYIIDEVHMLSTSAFNAFLKTLEEPPPFVLFIFATTEPHKVLPTILSRCQRFDFHRISTGEMVARLRDICDQEDISADEDALLLIAKKGDGALRDALSVFDQAVALCGTELQYGELAQALGVVDIDLYFEVTDQVKQQDSAGILSTVDHLVMNGFDFLEFLGGLTEHLRNIFVIRTTGGVGMVDASESVLARYQEEAESFTETELLRALMLLEQAESAIKGSIQPRLKLEMALLKLVNVRGAVDIRELIQRLDGLEARIKHAAEPVSSGDDTEDPPLQTGGQPSPTRGTQEQKKQTPSPPPEGTAERRDTRAGDHVTRSGVAEPLSNRISPNPKGEDRRNELLGEPAIKRLKADLTGSPPTLATILNGSTDPETDVLIEESDPMFDRIQNCWAEYVRLVKAERIHVGSLLQHGAPSAMDGDHVQIAVPDDFHVRLLTNQRDFLYKHLCCILNDSAPALTFIAKKGVNGHAAKETDQEIDPFEEMQRLRKENPIVRAIFEQFGGELVW